jgi:NADPH:quinone reductase-like Zn-dependent oxidoreductase
MRAIAMQRFGGPEVLELVDLPTPTAGPGEVLVRIVATSVNPVDWKIREGFLQKGLPHRFPVVPGWDAAGIVEATGEGARRFSRGDAVWAYTRLPEVHHGSYAELLALPEGHLARKPASLLFHEAGAVPLAGLTSWQALMRKGDVGPGATVLVHAAAGGVGHLAVQIAKSAGARVLGTAGPANQAFLRELGVDHPIDHAAGDFRDAVRAVCPEGVTVAFDTVGGDVQARTFDVVKKGGRLVSIATRPDAAEADKRGIVADYVFVEPSSSELDRLAALADEGKLRPHISAILPLAAAGEAQTRSREGRTRGKIVIALGFTAGRASASLHLLDPVEAQREGEDGGPAPRGAGEGELLEGVAHAGVDLGVLGGAGDDLHGVHRARGAHGGLDGDLGAVALRGAGAERVAAVELVGVLVHRGEDVLLGDLRDHGRVRRGLARGRRGRRARVLGGAGGRGGGGRGCPGRGGRGRARGAGGSGGMGVAPIVTGGLGLRLRGGRGRGPGAAQEEGDGEGEGEASAHAGEEMPGRAALSSPS